MALANSTQQQASENSTTVRVMSALTTAASIGYAIAAAMGEGAALYALGADRSTGFLVLMTGSSMAFMLLALVFLFTRRFWR